MSLESIAYRVAGIYHTNTHNVRVGGKIEFVKDTGPLRRDIRVQGFNWAPDSLRNLAKILWAVQRAHSYAASAHRIFSKMPSSEFSPDGLLGGRGYIQNIKDMRSSLSNAIEVMSSFADTVHDEINADHWSSSSGDPAVEEIVDDANEVKANPEHYVEQEFAEDVPEAAEDMDVSDMNPSSEDMNPVVESESDDDSDHFSLLPTGGGAGDGFHQMSSPMRRYEDSIRRILLRRHEASARSAGLPTGETVLPRMDKRGPAEGTEAGHYNVDDVWPSDDPTGSGFSQHDHLLEDGMRDGVVGDGPTDGDETIFKISARIANYSLLPGSANDKPMNYYGLGITDDDVEWMKENSDPDVGSDEDRAKEKVRAHVPWSDEE
jgi:hypothetical protein